MSEKSLTETTVCDGFRIPHPGGKEEDGVLVPSSLLPIRRQLTTKVAELLLFQGRSWRLKEIIVIPVDEEALVGGLERTISFVIVVFRDSKVSDPLADHLRTYDCELRLLKNGAYALVGMKRPANL